MPAKKILIGMNGEPFFFSDVLFFFWDGAAGAWKCSGPPGAILMDVQKPQCAENTLTMSSLCSDSEPGLAFKKNKKKFCSPLHFYYYFGPQPWGGGVQAFASAAAFCRQETSTADLLCRCLRAGEASLCAMTTLENRAYGMDWVGCTKTRVQRENTRSLVEADPDLHHKI